MFNTIEEALTSFEKGNPIVVVDDEHRENEGDIIFAAEGASQEKINLCASHAKGLICLAIDAEIAQKLELSPMNSNKKDSFQTAFYDSIDATTEFGITTGISAKERAITAALAANPTSKPENFSKPGHLFPVVAKAGGVLYRNGHTEAAVDLCKLTKQAPAAIMCEIMDSEGGMMRREGLSQFAQKHGLCIITIQQLIDYRNKTENHIEPLSKAFLPTQFGNLTIQAFRNTLNKTEHVVLSCTEDTQKTPIVRFHSECITGDVFGSLKCDCQEQLHEALKLIAENKHGYLIYLKGHEGRGIGISNKIAAYHLQEQGLNTYEANTQLGLSEDSRTYQDALWILEVLKLKTLKFLSNNPAKLQALTSANLVFERLELPISPNPHNQQYLSDKINIAKHLINFAK
jgi:3,4-dihydroxy 2-butanone 4-phosphate synthase/GTP cyclohydrolase II